MTKISSMRKMFLIAGMFVFLSVAARPAQAVSIIDFEGLSDFDSVTNQFAALNVFFSNATAAVAPPDGTLNEIDFPPTSGTTLVTNEALGPMTISFGAAPVISVGGYFVYGDFELSGDPLEFSIFGPSDAFTPLYSIYLSENLGLPSLISFSGWGPIASLSVIGAEGSYFTLDDLSFDRATEIPEPSTVILLAVALLGFALKTKCEWLKS